MARNKKNKTTIFNQDTERQALYKYINDTGRKYVYVAVQIGVSQTVMSRFRHGMPLWDESYLKLKEFLASEGY